MAMQIFGYLGSEKGERSHEMCSEKIYVTTNDHVLGKVAHETICAIRLEK